MQIKHFVLFPLLMLSACAHAPVATQVNTVTVPKVVITKCLTPDQVPAKPKSLKRMGEPADMSQALAWALAKVSEWSRYGDKADKLMSICTADE